MPEEISTAEMYRDLATTQREAETCGKISNLIEAFIASDPQEDRSRYKIDAFRYRALSNHANELALRIKNKIEEREKIAENEHKGDQV